MQRAPAILTPPSYQPCQSFSTQIHVPVYSLFCDSWKSQGHFVCPWIWNYLLESGGLSNRYTPKDNQSGSSLPKPTAVILEVKGGAMSFFHDRKACVVPAGT